MEYSVSNDKLTIVVSTRGAELWSIKAGDVEYLWNGDPTYWPDRSPVLFPYVGRFTGGEYRYEGSAYPMDIHGFARRMEFTVAGQDECSITLLLTDNDQTYENYPFHFILRITYTLKDSSVQIRYEIENTSDRTMYFGLGAHPGFNVPLEEGLAFSDYHLEFAGKHTPSRVGHTESCFLNGQDTPFNLEDDCRLPLNHGLFDEDAVVLKNVANGVTLKSRKGTRSVTVTYPDMPYLGLWHVPHTEAPYLCIEPWTSLPSRQDIVEEFQYKSDLIRLRSKAVYRNQWEITIG